MKDWGFGQSAKCWGVGTALKMCFQDWLCYLLALAQSGNTGQHALMRDAVVTQGY